MIHHEFVSTTKYEVTERREVPASTMHRGLITGKRVVEVSKYAGQKAACVRLEDGRWAWGFGPTEQAALEDGVAKALNVGK